MLQMTSMQIDTTTEGIEKMKKEEQEEKLRK